MKPKTNKIRQDVFLSVNQERNSQVAVHGPQVDLQDGTGYAGAWQAQLQAKLNFATNQALNVLSWHDVLEEEVLEAFAESDPAKLERELIQVAAVAVAWVEALRRRQARG